MGAVEKSPEAFRTISEVAETLDIPAHVLRFWESRFTQIRPVKRGGGRRYYRPQDVNLLRGIRDLLYRDGLTIKGVQKILREQGVKHVAGLGEDQVEGQVEDQVEVGADTAAVEPAPPPAPAPAPAPQPAAATPPPMPEPAVAAPPPPAPEPERQRIVPDMPIRRTQRPQQEVQYDLFAEEPRQARPPFPPDPEDARRTQELRRLIGKLQALRDKMASR